MPTEMQEYLWQKPNKWRKLFTTDQIYQTDPEPRTDAQTGPVTTTMCYQTQPTLQETTESPISAANLATSSLLNLPLEIIQEILGYTLVLDQEDDGRYSVSAGSHSRSIGQVYALSKLSTRSFIQKTTEISHELQRVVNGNVVKGGVGITRHDTNLVQHRCKKKTLLAVAATCRHLYVAAQPLIYETVEIDLNTTIVRPFQSTQSTNREDRSALGIENGDTPSLGGEAPRKVSIWDMLPRFIKSPNTASNVRSISFSNDWQRILPRYLKRRRYSIEGDTSEMASDSSITPEEITNRICQWPSSTRIKTVLNLLPNLQVLKIQQGYGAAGFLDAFKLSNPGSNLPTSLQNLTEISLLWNPGEVDLSFRVGPSDLLPLFLLPKIRSLHMKLPLSPTTPEDISNISTELFGKSRLRTLIFEQYTISGLLLTALLQLPSALENFAYTPEDGHSNISLCYTAAALQVQRATLRTIDLKVCQKDRNGLSTTFPETFWTRFTALRHLSIPLPPMLVMPNRTARDIESLNHAFPKSIEGLRFYIFMGDHPLGDRDCETWRKWRRHVNSIRRAAYPDLKNVWVGVWDSDCSACWIVNSPFNAFSYSYPRKEYVHTEVKHLRSMPVRGHPRLMLAATYLVMNSGVIIAVSWIVVTFTVLHLLYDFVVG